MTRTSLAAKLMLCGLLAACGVAEDQAPGVPPDHAAVPLPMASGLPLTGPASVGMSAEGLDQVRPAMQAYIDDGRLAGVVTMVARRGQVVHWDAVGMRDLDAGDPLENDDIFRIFSMTKPITSTAIMILVEDSKVALDDPLSKFVPEFADVQVLNDKGKQVPANGPITVQHLLTHTSGLTYGFFGNSPVDRIYNESGIFANAQGLDEFVTGIAGLPLLAHPGEVWNYSVSTDILGRVVEVASGQTFDAFLNDRIIGPLDMEDTAFQVSADKLDRFSGSYATVEGALRLTDSPVDGQYTRPPARPPARLAVRRRRPHLDGLRLHPIRTDAAQRGRAGGRPYPVGRPCAHDAHESSARRVGADRARELPEPGVRLRTGVRGGCRRGCLTRTGPQRRAPLGRRGQHLLLDRPAGGARGNGLDAIRPVRRLRDRTGVPDDRLRVHPVASRRTTFSS